jgi:hypothetical protein
MHITESTSNAGLGNTNFKQMLLLPKLDLLGAEEKTTICCREENYCKLAFVVEIHGHRI